MLFNSYEFIFLFFPLVGMVFFFVGARRHRLAAAWLALASVFFYGWWSVGALPILLGAVVANYAFSGWIGLAGGLSETRRKRVLQLALVANLLLLGFFKYTNFFIANANAALGAWGLPPMPVLDVMLPIGISFFTFTQIAFLVDCWQGKAAERNFVHYLLFVTYFPHLIAGPVLHHAQMMPQFARRETYRFDHDKAVLGLATFVIGLSKKLLVADPLGQYADLVFNSVSAGTDPGFQLAWLGTLAYTFQIYFDFSGYSDMAVGLSLVLGIRLPINFDGPYRATSIIDFWRRWHISLSTFLRDYLYIPLGGNRHGAMRRHLNLFITMVLGGLWHGANWTFVLWGAAHGVLLALNHGWRHLRGTSSTSVLSRWSRGGGWLLTFVCVCFTWVLFRADSLATALRMMQGLLGMNGLSAPLFQALTLPYKQAQFGELLILGFFICLCCPTTQRLGEYVPRVVRWVRFPKLQAVLGAMLATVTFGYCVSRLGQHSPFLYFQF